VIEDLQQFESGKSLAFDLCVVGAGPAGITIANELIGSGIRLCLVESGGFGDEPETQALYQGENVGHSVTLDEGRYRVFGGSATGTTTPHRPAWGGRCAMLDPIDFETRQWVPKSGWPIDLETLRPYYERSKRANNFLEPWLPDDAVPATLGVELPEFHSQDVNPFVWRIAPAETPPSAWKSAGPRKRFDWGRAYRQKLQADPDVHVLLHANLTSFVGSADGSSIETITVSSLKHVSMTIAAKAFVLCCGGIENARVLLNAPQNIVKRVNEFDNLGRYLAQHPRGCIATLETTPQTDKRLQNLFTDFLRPDDVQYELGFALSEQAQRKHGLLNASAAIYYAAGPESPWRSGARLQDAVRTRKPYQGILRDVANVLGSADSVAANTWRRVRGRALLFPDPLVSILIDLEQAPNPQSRVTLSDMKDSLGMNRAKVDWRISEIERTTARQFSDYIGDVLQRLGLGKAQPSAWLGSDLPVQNDELYGTFHFIGTTRMSRDPRDGVVDENCRSHGIDNLYFAGCSVFPTGGHANPTLTIVALAIRLADHLRARLRN
jgi:choline dehydrogenase-like flavoprotein